MKALSSFKYVIVSVTYFRRSLTTVPLATESSCKLLSPDAAMLWLRDSVLLLLGAAAAAAVDDSAVGRTSGGGCCCCACACIDPWPGKATPTEALVPAVAESEAVRCNRNRFVK